MALNAFRIYSHVHVASPSGQASRHPALTPCAQLQARARGERSGQVTLRAALELRQPKDEGAGGRFGHGQNGYGHLVLESRSKVLLYSWVRFLSTCPACT